MNTLELSVNSSENLPKIQLFEKSEFGSVRITTENGKVLFCGKDVAIALGYKEPTKAIRTHCKAVSKMDIGVITGKKSDGTDAIQNVTTSFIPEGDVYRLIVSSKLPTAQKFESWVFDEVLPTIRKTGTYSVPQSFAEALQLAANQAKEIEQMKPKAEVFDKICNSESLKSVDTVASNLGFGKNNFFALMRGMGIFFYSSKDAEGKKVNLPKQEYKDAGYFVTKEEPYTRGEKNMLYTKIYVTGKGEAWLAKKIFDESGEKYLEEKQLQVGHFLK